MLSRFHTEQHQVLGRCCVFIADAASELGRTLQNYTQHVCSLRFVSDTIAVVQLRSNTRLLNINATFTLDNNAQCL